MHKADNKLVIEIADQLSAQEIEKIRNSLKLPLGLFENISEGRRFLNVLKDWGKHDPYQFYLCLQKIGRNDLTEKASKIPWLSFPYPIEGREHIQEELSMKTLVRTLSSELQTKDWDGISLIISGVKYTKSFSENMKILVQQNCITKDLKRLMELMSDIKRNDIEAIVNKHQIIFQKLSKEDFTHRFINEVATQEKEIEKWEHSLRKFIEVQNRSVQQMFDDSKTVDLESIYVDLTIIKELPVEVDPNDETTYSEIAYMRKIAKKEIEIIPVNFTNILREFGVTKPEIGCIIGNPGSGKSFLCHRTALRFGKGELSQFTYCLSIPCRDMTWHQMEKDRAGKSVDGEFVQRWISLSMPAASSWTKDLAKHIWESDGEKLLLIIDSMDEFTKDVSFKETLLFLLLTRETLFRSSILITSRPGAYTVISSQCTLKIDAFYHVLGFSPLNRNIYFLTQLGERNKLKQLQKLLHLHEEVNQLSLIPVNASLFAALFRGSDNLSVYTLTNLYQELVTYLIRRQLFRMGLEELAKKRSLFQLHFSVLDCLYQIGEMAYTGVYHRELISSKDILIKVEKVERPCHCLGLAEEHTKKDELGNIIHLWTFAHLTLQEFVSAIWLRMCSMGDQCLSTRYIVNSDSIFNMFRMVIRFVCGLLAKDSVMHILHILYKYIPIKIMPMQGMPLKYQYYQYTNVLDSLGWFRFTTQFMTLSELLHESKSESLKDEYQTLMEMLPQKFCLYIKLKTPNEWEALLWSLQFVRSIEILYFHTNNFTVTQLSSLLSNINSCSLKCLIAYLDEQDYSTFSAFCDTIFRELPSKDTKVNICLIKWKKSEQQTDNALLPDFGFFTSWKLHPSPRPDGLIKEIYHQMMNTDYLDLHEMNYYTLQSCLFNATNLVAFSLHDITIDFHPILQHHLPLLTKLQEITLEGEGHYSLLPYISGLSNLKYIEFISENEPTVTYNKRHFLKLLKGSAHTLIGLRTWRLEAAGFTTWDEILSTLISCTKLVEIDLTGTALQGSHPILWSGFCIFKSLRYLDLGYIRLSEYGLIYLCVGLLHHPSIRELHLPGCHLPSNTCLYLTCLIPTLPMLNKLDLKHSNTSNSNSNSFKTLKETAEAYSIDFNPDDQD